MPKTKYAVNWPELVDESKEELQSRIDTICDYVNADGYPSLRVVLAMLKINEVKGEEDERVTD